MTVCCPVWTGTNPTRTTDSHEILVTFINQLMHSIDTVVDVKICVV